MISMGSITFVFGFIKLPKKINQCGLFTGMMMTEHTAAEEKKKKKTTQHSIAFKNEYFITNRINQAA